MGDRLWEEAPRFFTYYNLVFLAQAAGSTLALTVLGCGLGFTLGFALVYVRTTESPWLLPLRVVIVAYVELFRRIPFLVILFLVLFLVQVIDPTVSLFGIAAVSICIVSTAFLSEIIRAGFESVPRQQLEAAAAMNFGRWRTVRHVILPQAWRVILPPAFAFAVMFIKDTSLASQMGVVELTFAGKVLNNRGFSGLLVFGTVLGCYFALSYPLSRLGAWLETRLAGPRHQGAERRLRPSAGPARHLAGGAGG